VRASLLLLLAVASCRGAPAPRAVAAIPASAAVAEPAEDLLPPAIRAAFTAHGALHGPVLRVPALPRSSEPERWIAFLGSPGVARAAWGVDGRGAPYPITGWPVGVRVIASVVDGSGAKVLVESVGVLDQPRGMRGVVKIGVTSLTGPRGEHPLEARSNVSDSVGVTDAETQRAAQERASRPFSGALDAAAALAARAGTSPAALAAALPPGGAERFEVWQTSLLRPLGRIEPGAVATSPDREAVPEALRTLGRSRSACGPDACSDGGVTATFERGALRALARAVPAPPVTASRPRGVIAGAPPSQATAARLGELVSGATLLTETKLGSTGTAAVATLGEDGFVAVLLDGDFGAVFPLHVTGPEVAWLDAGGGNLAVLAGRARGYRVRPLPPLSVLYYPTNGGDLGDDESALVYEIAAMRATTPTEAVAAVLETPDETVSLADACTLLKRARTAAGFRAVAAPGAYLFRFAQPHAVSYEAEVVPAAKVTTADLERIDEGCLREPESDQAIVCRGAVCGVFNYALGNFYWFTRVRGKLKLRAAGIYVGS